LVFSLQYYNLGGKIMSFTPKVRGILTIAVVGCIGWISHIGPTTAPVVTAQKSFQISEQTPVVPAIELRAMSDWQAGGPGRYQLISSWYKNKHWWKRNAPIIGGAGGGALIGGLAGGGKGALIGGAAGGGGGYLYKRLRHDHHHYHH
jgi:hypothetical protein